MLTRVRMKASEDAPEEMRWGLTLPGLGREPVTTCAWNFVWTGALTVAIPAVGALLLTHDWAPTAAVAAIAATLHLLRYTVPRWAWVAAGAVGCGAMMWIIGGSVFQTIWALSIVPIAWVVEARRGGHRT
jgi:hypothetical protein